jgi:hypothetical protein
LTPQNFHRACNVLGRLSETFNAGVVLACSHFLENSDE